MKSHDKRSVVKSGGGGGTNDVVVVVDEGERRLHAPFPRVLVRETSFPTFTGPFVPSAVNRVRPVRRGSPSPWQRLYFILFFALSQPVASLLGRVELANRLADDDVIDELGNSGFRIRTSVLRTNHCF